MNTKSTSSDPETIVMTKANYRSYQKRAAAAGVDVLVYIRRNLDIPARRPITVLTFDSVKDFPTQADEEAAA
jgi:hypothetical protein